MKLFIDTANVDEIRLANDLGGNLRRYNKSIAYRKGRPRF